MAMGRRKHRQRGLWIETGRLARGPGHPFYQRLNGLLAQEGFDTFAEAACEKFYADVMGRPSLAPGVYFRLLLIGYFEGIDSERGIAWRVADSLALREFLGFELTQGTPDHSTLSRTRRLIPRETHEEVFTWVVCLLAKKGLLRGKTLAIDATTLEANAALRSIVRRDTGESYQEFLERLAKASGIATPTREDLARIDRDRDGKGSNGEWRHPHDPEARITKMKDGRTHLAHKAEHLVDLETGAIVAVTVQTFDGGDTASSKATIQEAMDVIADVMEDSEASAALSPLVFAELVADKGYHSNEVLQAQAELGIRTYISEPRRGKRQWRGKARARAAVHANRRRMRGERGKRLSRRRGEYVERGFAHCYGTGGMRRVHLRGHTNIRKRLVVHTAAFDLGLVMRKAFGAGTPRGLAARLRGLCDRLAAAKGRFRAPIASWITRWLPVVTTGLRHSAPLTLLPPSAAGTCATGC
jgi:transposase